MHSYYNIKIKCILIIFIKVFSDFKHTVDVLIRYKRCILLEFVTFVQCVNCST